MHSLNPSRRWRAAERRTPSLPDIANTCEPMRGGSSVVVSRHPALYEVARARVAVDAFCDGGTRNPR